MKLSTLSTLPSRTMPSLRMRSSSIFIVRLFLPIFLSQNGRYFISVYRILSRLARLFLPKFDSFSPVFSALSIISTTFAVQSVSQGGRFVQLSLVFCAKSSILVAAGNGLLRPTRAAPGKGVSI